MTLVPVTSADPEVAALLAHAMYPDPVRMAAALARYETEPERQVWGWHTEGRVVSAAGMAISGRVAEVLHIGTRPEARGQGYGRLLLLALYTHLKLDELLAETDDDAVEFYRKAGFAVIHAESRGGQARYRCTLSVQ